VSQVRSVLRSHPGHHRRRRRSIRYCVRRCAEAAVSDARFQGLRARGGDGRHRVLSELMQAQLPRHRRTLREFDWMRQKRNDTPYPDPDKPTATANDVSDGIAAANGSLSWESSSWNSSPLSARQGRSLRCSTVPGQAIL
jgi:hypothetical protein